MAVKKAKISSIKKQNLKRNKPLQKTKSKSKKHKVSSKRSYETPQKKVQIQPAENEESDQGEDLIDMWEEEDLNFVKEAVENHSYSLLPRLKIPRSASNSQKGQKRKLNVSDEDELEKQYENQEIEEIQIKNLLPIKSKTGIITRTTVISKQEGDQPVEEEEIEFENAEENAESDIDLEIHRDIEPDSLVTTAEILAAREETLRQRKIHIGTLSSGLLENPEEKIYNFKTLLKLVDEYTPEVFLTVRKLTLISLLEIFKDLLPSYEIKQQEQSGIKLKKDTLKLQKYEVALLQYYKHYLKRLEKFTSVLIKKKGDTRIRTEEQYNLAQLSLHCMCELLVVHPYFNYSQNIAQVVVPFLNSRKKSIREMVKLSCKTVFKDDKKGEITLKILRVINSYLKTHAHNVNTDMLEVLLSLKIKDVNLDQEKEQEIKQKKYTAHKHKILQLSKKEKKRKKRLEQLEKEMLETKAEENKHAKQQCLTEITKVVFTIFFRILKSSTNTKVLGVSLAGLAKFSHCINMEFYTDLVTALKNLLQAEWLGYREQLHCVQTVLTILTEQEVLNLDPSQFYINLYKNLLTVHAGNNYKDFNIILETLITALIKRRKKITRQRLIGFTKRICILSLQLLHNGTLSSLGIIKSILQLSKTVDVLLDMDSAVGDGKYFPQLEDPEYCNAASTALFELILLTKHYHPVVRRMAKHIAAGVPITGEGSLAPELGKCTPEQLYMEYDPSLMAFNPAVLIPKASQPKSKWQRVHFVNSDLKEECYNIAKSLKHDFVK